MVGHGRPTPDWAMFLQERPRTPPAWPMVAARAQTKRKDHRPGPRAPITARRPGARHARPAPRRKDRANQIFCTYNDIASLEEAGGQGPATTSPPCFAAPFKARRLSPTRPCPIPPTPAGRGRYATRPGRFWWWDDVRAGIAHRPRLFPGRWWGSRPDLSTWGQVHPPTAIPSRRSWVRTLRAKGASLDLRLRARFLVRRIADGGGAGDPEGSCRRTNYLEHMEGLGARLRDGPARASRLPRPKPAPDRTGADAALPVRRKTRTCASASAGRARCLKRGVYVAPLAQTCSCATP